MKNFFENNKLDHDTVTSFFSQAPVAMAVLKGRDMIIEAVNSLMVDYLGISENVIGVSVYDIQGNFNTLAFVQALEDVFEKGITHSAQEEKLKVFKNGDFFTGYYDYSFSPLKNSDGDILGVIVISNDVTKQVINKLEQQETDKRFRNLIMESDVPTIFLKGEDLIIDIINDKGKQYINKTNEDVIGMKIGDALPKSFNYPFAESLKEVYKTGKTYREEEAKIEFIDNGQHFVFYVNITCKPLFDSDGKIYGILNMGIDITNQVIYRKLTKQSEERLKQIISSIPLAISIVKGKDFNIEMSNKGSIDLWGSDYSKVGLNVLDAYPEVRNHDIIKHLTECFETQKQIITKEMEVNLSHIDSPRYMNYIFTPIEEDEENERAIIAVGYDVSEELFLRKKLEESEIRFKNLANSIPDIVWTAKPDGKIDYFNDRWYQFSGFSKNDQIIVNWIDHVHPDDIEKVHNIWSNAIKRREKYEIEYRMKSKLNSEYTWFLARGIPIKSDGGEILKWIGSTTDINDFILFQKQKDDFLAITSHELKTPLTSIKLYGQALERLLLSDGNEKGASYAKKMETQINRLNFLINDLLDVTKIQNGKLQLNASLFDFDQLIYELVEANRISSLRHEIVVKGDKVGFVTSDRERISQVMQNFISNAIKYSPAANQIIISCNRINNNEIQFCVQDFGIGIPKNKQIKIFEQFYRVNEGETNTFEGLGLGLYISDQIIRRCKGKISLKSEINKGSTFCFILPNNL